ncbi:MAG: hypothetical protein IPM95_06040 [Sphingobacteriales bacterium]|jgi:hypothetical protein|nr:hypothetical protein [Sphingobacteriales bacterium]
MKKLTVFAFAAILTLGASSCKKACKCTITDAALDPAAVSAFNTAASAAGSNQTLCDAVDASVTAVSTVATDGCSLK